jgi:hypothetical protein
MFQLWTKQMAIPDCKHFRHDQHLTMKAALALACIELGISDTDRSKRETVAILMAPLAKNGHASIDQMKTFAVAQFCKLKSH